MAQAVTIYVNDQPHSFPSAVSVEQVLAALGHAGRRGVAIAVNDNVVPRREWTTRQLNAGERLLVIQATQGG